MNNLAIWISIVSVLIAGISLGWNIYKEIRRPRVKVGLSFYISMGPNGIKDKPLLMLTATNFGPKPAIIEYIILKESFDWIKSIFKKKAYAILFLHNLEPFSPKFPYHLKVGDQVQFILRYDGDCFLKYDYSRIGLHGRLGTNYWSSRKDIKRAKIKYNNLQQNNQNEANKQ